MEENKSKKKQVNKKVLISIIGIIIALVGASYAVWHYTFNGTLKNTISTNDISLDLLESNTNIITIENALPISDNEGKAQTQTFDFAVTSKTTKDTIITYKLSIEKLSVDSGYTALNDNQIKIYLTDYNNNLVLNPTKISDLNNYVFYSGAHYHDNNNETKQNKFKLRAWIDGGVDANSWNASTKLQYKFKINLTSSEVTETTDINCFNVEGTTVTGFQCTPNNSLGLPVVTDVVVPSKVKEPIYTSVEEEDKPILIQVAQSQYGLSEAQATAAMNNYLDAAAQGDEDSIAFVTNVINQVKASGVELKTQPSYKERTITAVSDSLLSLQLSSIVIPDSARNVNNYILYEGNNNSIYRYGTNTVFKGSPKESLGNYTDYYKYLNKNIFLKHNMENNSVKSSEACYILNNTLYCLKGEGATYDSENSEYNNDSIYYEDNVSILKSSFGESNCSVYYYVFSCSVSGLQVDASTNGTVIVRSDFSRCGVGDNGDSDCSE